MLGKRFDEMRRPADEVRRERVRADERGAVGDLGERREDWALRVVGTALLAYDMCRYRYRYRYRCMLRVVCTALLAYYMYRFRYRYRFR